MVLWSKKVCYCCGGGIYEVRCCTHTSKRASNTGCLCGINPCYIDLSYINFKMMKVTMRKYSKIIVCICGVLCLISCTSTAPVATKTVRVAELPEDFAEQRQEYEDKKQESEATKWGNAETKPWNQRYIGEYNSNVYQGNVK